MYTEENEFDYEDYGNNNQNKGFINGSLITKIILIVICLAIIIFLVFKIKGLSSNKNNNNDNSAENIALVFDNNMQSLRRAGETYFFTDKNVPTNLKEEKSVSIAKLQEEGIITEVLDYNGNKCGYNTSTVSMVKNKNDYLMTVRLVCASMEDTVEYYYDKDFNCLTCNGETYVSDDSSEEDNNNNDNNNSNNDNNNNNSNNDNNNNTPTNVCGTWSDWSTAYVDDDTLDRESRTLIKAYKDEKVYGEWSEPTKEAPTNTTGIEVQTKEVAETVTEYTDWSSKSTTKPSSKEGREIETSTASKPYKSTTCTNKKSTYTKTVTGRDSKALKCVKDYNNFGKYICTYEGTKKVCSTKTKYKTVTYYSYRDKVEKQQTVTYYQTRTVTSNPIYTDYILESEIPSGYTKVAGSELVQYRYRQKCIK